MNIININSNHMKLLLKLTLFFVIFVVTVITGAHLFLNTGKTVTTSWTENDYENALEKSKVIIENIEEINLNNLTKGDFTTQGENEVQASFTSEELSALISKANNKHGPIKNVSFLLGDNNQTEVSFVLSENFIDFLKEQNILSSYDLWSVQAVENDINKYLDNQPEEATLTDAIVAYISGLVNNKPVYAKGELYRDSANSVKLEIDSLYVGRAPLPQDVIKKVEYETVRVVNNIISPENGFHVEELHVKNGKLHFRGTLPAEVEGRKIR